MPTDKVLIFGRGQMGTQLVDYFNRVELSSADITRVDRIEKEIKSAKPSVIINTAAMTSLEECELNKLAAFKVNVLAPYEIAKLCRKYKIYFVQFSSGCVYSSQTSRQIYQEADRPNPASYYSWTKVWMENLLSEFKNILIVRPRVPVSTHVSPRNTLVKLLTYHEFIRNQNTISVLEDIFPALVKMIKERLTGVYHLANPGTIAPYEIAKMLKKAVYPDLIIIPSTQEKINQKLIAKRVSTILNLEKLAKAGIVLPEIRSRVKKVISDFAVNLAKQGGLKAIDKVYAQTHKKFALARKIPRS